MSNPYYVRKGRRYSQTERAQYQREARVCKFNERHFNNPLRAFVEHKYPSIFSEYTRLYERMTTAHPHRKSLVRTSTFKQWRQSTEPTSAMPIPQCGDVLSQAIQETIASDANISLPVEQETNDLPIEQDPIPPEQGPQQLYRQIDDILDEMISNEDLRNLLEQPNSTEDEGIELNLLDEIYEDIEPFDSELEVE